MTEERRKFSRAEKAGRTMARRIMERLPQVEGLEPHGLTDRLDFKFISGDSKTFLEVKYRSGHTHTEYTNVRIQRSKWKEAKRRKGFLLQIFEDSWWLWYLGGDVEPCDTGWWTHWEHTVLGDEKVTDEYAAFSYNDVLYYYVK